MEPKVNARVRQSAGHIIGQPVQLPGRKVDATAVEVQHRGGQAGVSQQPTIHPAATCAEPGDKLLNNSVGRATAVPFGTAWLWTCAPPTLAPAADHRLPHAIQHSSCPTDLRVFPRGSVSRGGQTALEFTDPGIVQYPSVDRLARPAA